MISFLFMAAMAELPWIEKYRPERLSGVVGQKDITSRLQAYVKNGSMPNLFDTNFSLNESTTSLRNIL